MFSGQMVQADGMLQHPFFVFCILNQRQSATSPLRRNKDRRSRLTLLLPFSIPSGRFSLPVEASYHLSDTEETLWSQLVETVPEFLRCIKKDLNHLTQDAITKNQLYKLSLFCDEDILLHIYSTKCHIEDCKNMLNHLKNSTAHSPNGPSNNSNDWKRINSELISRDDLVEPRICNTSVSCERNKNTKKRMSVSFDDDVIVYLFDKESPIVELHTGPCTSLLSNFSCKDTSENPGLEWEDDFSTLEKSYQFQCVTESVSRYYDLQPSARSRHFFLSQSCLYLTYVTESDLEL
ncbi:uncharacterized protein [Antennarius striatus]|uniref:uncharacterized protein n=1 Tax=Antennarius striatus TaxID=241820 RepID=UPI0035B1A6EB